MMAHVECSIPQITRGGYVPHLINLDTSLYMIFLELSLIMTLRIHIKR